MYNILHSNPVENKFINNKLNLITNISNIEKDDINMMSSRIFNKFFEKGTLILEQNSISEDL